MPIGYLVTTALLASCALVAVAPPKPATTTPRSVVYLLGFVINELPFVAGYLLVGSTALAAVQSNLFTWAGLVGLALAVVAGSALVVIARRGLAARSRLAATLDATFDVSNHNTTSRMPLRHRWWRLLFAPVSFRGRQVRRVANVSYGPGGRRNLLDVYHHKAREGGPVLVYFHGGAFRSGHKSREAKPLLHRLARHGWVCISANYRLAPEVRFPDHLVDAKRVIAWARHHAGRYGGDASRIFAAGSSAGGHLAITAALTPNRPEFQPGFIDDDTTVQGAVSLYGFYGSAPAEAGVASSPHAYINAAAPPVFMAHGDNDTVVLVDDARTFADEVRAVSLNPVLYAELPGAQHGFDLFRSPRFEAVVDAIEVFLARTDHHD